MLRRYAVVVGPVNQPLLGPLYEVCWSRFWTLRGAQRHAEGLNRARRLMFPESLLFYTAVDRASAEREIAMAKEAMNRP